MRKNNIKSWNWVSVFVWIAKTLVGSATVAAFLLGIWLHWISPLPDFSLSVVESGILVSSDSEPPSTYGYEYSFYLNNHNPRQSYEDKSVFYYVFVPVDFFPETEDIILTLNTNDSDSIIKSWSCTADDIHIINNDKYCEFRATSQIELFPLVDTKVFSFVFNDRVDRSREYVIYYAFNTRYGSVPEIVPNKSTPISETFSQMLKYNFPKI